MAKNWDTETAKSCRIPDYVPYACDICRDRLYCQKNKYGLVQMSIFDYMREINEKKSQEWQRVPENCVIKAWDEDDCYIPLIETVTEQSIMAEPDKVVKGIVFIDGERHYAVLGLKEWRSGPDGIYVDYEAIQWKEKT